MLAHFDPTSVAFSDGVEKAEADGAAAAFAADLELES